MSPPKPKLDAPLEAGLYIVSTPIGNLRDLTLRALDVLAAADLILAEDTRVTAKLLSAYDLKKRMERYDDHVGERQRPKIIAELQAGARVALVSDAGTPLVSDPGYRLVGEVVAAGIAVHPIPGASALLAALAVAGLPTDRFLFTGFASPRSGARKALFGELAPVRATLVFYETGPRLAEALADMAEVFGDRPAAVARELTKLHETCIRGRLSELAKDERLQAPKGEIVVLVGPGEERIASADDADKALKEALTRAGPAEAAAEVAKALHLPRRELYKRALALKGVA